MSRLSKVIVRQTDTTEIIYYATSRVVNNVDDSDIDNNNLNFPDHCIQTQTTHISVSNFSQFFKFSQHHTLTDRCTAVVHVVCVFV